MQACTCPRGTRIILRSHLLQDLRSLR
jgi:hypothetical protein